MKLGEIVDEDKLEDTLFHNMPNNLMIYTKPERIAKLRKHLVSAIANLEVPLTIDEEKVKMIILRDNKKIAFQYRPDGSTGMVCTNKNWALELAQALKSKAGEIIIKERQDEI